METEETITLSKKDLKQFMMAVDDLLEDVRSLVDDVGQTPEVERFQIRNIPVLANLLGILMKIDAQTNKH